MFENTSTDDKATSIRDENVGRGQDIEPVGEYYNGSLGYIGLCTQSIGDSTTSSSGDARSRGNEGTNAAAISAVRAAASSSNSRGANAPRKDGRFPVLPRRDDGFPVDAAAPRPLVALWWRPSPAGGGRLLGPPRRRYQGRCYQRQQQQKGQLPGGSVVGTFAPAISAANRLLALVLREPLC